MPEYCPYCEGVLTHPPSCCVEAMDAHDSHRMITQGEKDDSDPWQDEGGEG